MLPGKDLLSLLFLFLRDYNRSMIKRLITGIVVLSLLLFVNFQFGFVRFGVTAPCACYTTEMFMQDQLEVLQSYIQETYSKTQEYPLFEDVKRFYERRSTQEGYSTVFKVNKYAVLQPVKEEGIYYSVSPNRELYSLRGFVKGKFLSVLNVLAPVTIPEKKDAATSDNDVFRNN